jgi:hypothetical protein
VCTQGGMKVGQRRSKIIFLHGSTALVGLGLLTVEASRSHTRHATLGTTPLDGWSARRRELWQHATTFTRDINPCLRRDSNQQSIPVSERPLPHATDRAATGSASKIIFCANLPLSDFITHYSFVSPFYCLNFPNQSSCPSARTVNTDPLFPQSSCFMVKALTKIIGTLADTVSR